MSVLLINPPMLSRRSGVCESFFAGQKRRLKPSQYYSLPIEHLGLMSIAAYAQEQGIDAWLDQSQVFYSLSTFQRRLGGPLTKGGLDEMEKEGWAYLDRQSDFLGESSLWRADLN